MLRRAIFVAAAWICLVGACAAQTLSFPALTGRVVDEAAVLDAAERAALTEALADLEKKTTDQLVVVTLKSLQGTSIEDYGYQLGRRWQIGQKDKNNGALLIVAPTERKVRIEVGYGLEGTLTDAIGKYIIETSILPRFKAGDFPGGIKRGVEDLIQVLSGDAEEWQRRAAQSISPNITQPDDVPLWLVIVIVLLGVGFLIFCATAGGANCQALLQALLLILLSESRSSHGRSSRSGGGFGGGGGTFGGGGSSGSW
ncbi:YgcG family protein [Hyphomicrobium sp.]|uniref:TPM domain-containing protein n=1 Tax=Hyphomicrobium sp. TaxID=82 RepID=UPI001D3E2C2E|nr:YgcG family protein [Hyphomicrobium sp.]MBY0560079.1 YgcG family protein [Hyphomicrobium sp.]